MTIRTSESTVTFAHAFSVGTMDRPQPAGTYRLISDDEEIPDLHMLVHRRIGSFCTRLRSDCPAKPRFMP